ncbi:AmmeMemoRadiSam system radical SAM enzyme [Mariprofundus erugo]|uniref:AmmeMemoRadiSam system radical SAM enzyme n=1 Tax=Mariprofundus erugo TaxID=2528639 RepID=UPI0010FE866D|nr:AmmeMemoRadiSam system radical SAM enzyme [Mariprofundus erugo]TLS74270.1 AmmeMemoRadiSam system radical SAM enzyme [Mariprofundus erugo]
MTADEHFAARYWHDTGDGRIQCDLCPRDCRLHDGQRGFCFVRKREGDHLVLTTYGRSSGFCIDPVEKKPLYHFYPGSAVLSFGTAGCNLACAFCQNWDISKSRAFDRLCDQADPEAIAAAALRHDCRAVAFTYNDPVIFLEYAVDTAIACHEAGVGTIAVTAGYIAAPAHEEFFAHMDAVNVDLKSFSDAFYHRLCAARLQPVLDTLRYIRHETDAWLEITTLLIPGENDSDEELTAMCDWIAGHLGPDVPLHFSAFHPDWKLKDKSPTPVATLQRARRIALHAGLHYVYTGNVRDPEGGSTYCPRCHNPVIARDWYEIIDYQLSGAGCCPRCNTLIAGHFGHFDGGFGGQRRPVYLHGG